MINTDSMLNQMDEYLPGIKDDNDFLVLVCYLFFIQAFDIPEEEIIKDELEKTKHIRRNYETDK